MLEKGLLNIQNSNLESMVAFEVAFEMRFLGQEDLPRIMALQEIVVQRLSRKDLLQALSREFMEFHIGAKGCIVGAFVQEELIAFCSGYFPDVDDREWNLGYDLGLEDPAELKTVANLQIICIHPDYRGYGLGMRMSSTVVGIIRRLNRYHHLCATASPYNYWSLNILLNCGFGIRSIKLKYGDKLRCIAYQNLVRPDVYPKTPDALAVRLTDIARQQELLKQGYIGVRIQAIPGFVPSSRLEYAEGYELLFAKSRP